MRISAILLALATGLAACAAPEPGVEYFNPAIDCAGPFLTPEMDPRCGVYRRRLND